MSTVLPAPPEDGGSDAATPLDIVGQALDFAGLGPFSVEVWARPTVRQSNYHYILSREVDSPRQGWGLFLIDTNISFERIVDGNFEIVGMDSPLALNAWSHVVVTFDGKNAFFYLNGAQQPGNVWISSLSVVMSNLSVDPGGAGGMIGSLDEIAIHAHAIGADRVLAHYLAKP